MSQCHFQFVSLDRQSESVDYLSVLNKFMNLYFRFVRLSYNLAIRVQDIMEPALIVRRKMNDSGVIPVISLTNKAIIVTLAFYVVESST